LPKSSVSYSIHSALPGVADVEIAILTLHAWLDLLQSDTETTAKVSEGQVYSVVLAAADRS
jgi:hypothetical protein